MAGFNEIDLMNTEQFKPSVQMIEGAELILKVLSDQGVEVIFAILAGVVLPIYDALFRNNSIQHILRAVMSRLLCMQQKGMRGQPGKVGVVLVTSGPGATNAVTGLTDAMMDSVPIVCLTGQVPSHLIGTDAFQEADTSGITRPCMKHNYLCKSKREPQANVEEALHAARSGPSGSGGD